MHTFTGKIMAVLLMAVMVLQLWSLTRQNALQQQIGRLSSVQSQTELRLRNELSSMQDRLRELVEAERWLDIRTPEIEASDTCDTVQVSLQWELLQWESGTTARLMYRTNSDQTWQGSAGETLGGQNYGAMFSVPLRPILRVGIDVNYPPGGDGRSVRTEAQGTDTGGTDLSYQYQIIAEGSNSSRSSGVRSLPLSREFVIPVKATVRVQDGGVYQVDLYSESLPERACTHLQDAEIRAYAGDQLVQSIPLEQEVGDPGRSAMWESDKPITKLELLLRHTEGEELVSVTLSGP